MRTLRIVFPRQQKHLRAIGTVAVCSLVWLVGAQWAVAQQTPEVGYLYPTGVTAGSTIDVVLGGYDWTPDMEIFVYHPSIQLEITGPPSEVLVPAPPYWFGKKARRPPFPLPREVPARLTVPADVSPGIVRWQAANANGTTSVGYFVVGNTPEILEEPSRKEPQTISQLPVAISGQIRNIEEVDRYRFTATENGPVTCAVLASEIGSPLNAIIEVHDDAGRPIADAADTEGRHLALTFPVEAGRDYVVSIYDLDFRGNRSFVYRMSLTAEPRVVAALPAAGRRGETQDVEFIGWGLETGAARLESIRRSVSFPAEPEQSSFHYPLKTDQGVEVSCSLGISDLSEKVASSVVAQEGRLLSLPCAVTGVLDSRYGQDRYFFEGNQDDLLAITAESNRLDRSEPLDLALTILNEAGDQLAFNDDFNPAAGTDPALEFRLPEDGRYELIVSDHSGLSGTPVSVYRLTVQPARPDFRLTIPDRLNIPIGGAAQLAVKVHRMGGFPGPISLRVAGLPAGVSIADEEAVIKEGQNEVKLNLKADENAAATAALVSIHGSAMLEDRTLEHGGGELLVATTLKPPFVVDAEGKDDVTKWPRGTTFPGPVLIQREEGFDGEIVLEMSARQGRHRQGIRGPELTVPPGVERILYPIFLPEWLETTRTSRMVVNGVAQIPDPQGNVRYVSSRVKTRIGFLPGGALLKISSEVPELEIDPGKPFEIPLIVNRVRELQEPLELTLILPPELQGRFVADPVQISTDESTVRFRIEPNSETASEPLFGDFELTIRATALQDGHLPVISETNVLLLFAEPMSVSASE